MRNTFEEISENLRNIYEKKQFMKEKEDRMRKSVCARAPQIRVKKNNQQQHTTISRFTYGRAVLGIRR